MVNISGFREGDAWGRFRRGSSIMADRLGLRCGWENRFLRVGIRARIPNTLHVYRAVIPTITSPDDYPVVAESRVRGRAISRQGEVQTHDRNIRSRYVMRTL